MNTLSHHLIVPTELAGLRLDQGLSQLLPQYSRSQLKLWIQNGHVKLDQEPCQRPNLKLKAEQQIDIEAILKPTERWEAQPIPIERVYEDDELIIINKPANLTVHPGAGQPDHTLVNALLHRFPELDTLPRAGLIHRLDKNTTGLLVVARNLSAHHALTQAMQERSIKREYEAVVQGSMISGGTINTPLARDTAHRTRFKVSGGGRPAITHYRIIKKFTYHTHIKIILETGRTHQIRVHMQSIRHPLVGDPTYGSKHKLSPKHFSEDVYQALENFPRQALHAAHLSLQHPATGEIMSWDATLPEDMTNLLNLLSKEL